MEHSRQAVAAFAAIGGTLLEISFLASGSDGPIRAAPLGAAMTSNAIADSYARSGIPAETHVSEPYLYVGYDGEEVRRALVRFDLSNLTSNAIVEAAELQLYLTSASAGGAVSRVLSTTKAISAWSESTVSWSSQSGFGPPSSARSVLTATGWYTWDVREVVKGWVSGVTSNDGFVVRAADETLIGTRAFASRELSCVAPPCFGPRLVISFTGSTATPTVTPTPTQTPTPTRTPTPSPRNLTVKKIEVTQAIQCIDEDGVLPDPSCPENGLPLMKNKTLAVRLYLGLSGASFPLSDVKGRLLTRPCGQAGGGVIHPPVWPAAKVSPFDTLTKTRTLTDTSLTYLVDKAYLEGGCLDFVGEVNPNREIAETSFADNTLELTNIRIHSSDNLNIKFVKIDYYPGFPNPFNPPDHLKPGWGNIQSMIPVVTKLYPVDKVKYWKASKEINITYFSLFKDFKKIRTWDYVLTKLWLIKAATDDEASKMHYYAMLHHSVPIGKYRGYGSNADWRVAAGVAGEGGILAHELGHNVNRRHAPCGGPDDVDPNWPDAKYPGADIMETGFDVDARETRRWNQWQDVVAYCDKWITPYTYRALYNRFQSNVASAAAPAEMVDHLAVSGVIDEDGTVGLNDWFHQPSSLSSDPLTGQYSVALQAADGRTLAVRRFDLLEHAGPANSGAFFLLVPYHAETSKVALYRGSTEVASRIVSGHAPQVQVVSPSGGERFGSSSVFTITWSATDADGDRLTYLIQYSRDSGATWQALEADWPETSLPADAAALAGSDQALIRVTASDGVNSGSGTSADTFFIERKPPEIEIFTPDGTTTGLGTGLLVRGAAFDAEDGPLEDVALRWASDRDGSIGAGDERVVQLSPGIHRITLTGRDSQGNESSAAITVVVSDTPSRLLIPSAGNGQSP